MKGLSYKGGLGGSSGGEILEIVFQIADDLEVVVRGGSLIDHRDQIGDRILDLDRILLVNDVQTDLRFAQDCRVDRGTR